MFRLLFWIIIPLFALSQSQQKWVDSVYTSMTIDQKIGQLFMVMAFPNGDNVSRANTLKQIENFHIGGVLFSKGTSKQQQLDTKSYQQKTQIPLLIAADAEWGMAMRLSDVSSYPYAMTLGALAHDDLIYALAKRMGERQRRMGVHMSFSPVADVNTEPQNPIIGIRSFGDDPDRVSQKAQAFMEGLQDAGLFAVAKHFPGHGAAKQDSHMQLPIIHKTKSQIDSVELIPFSHLIKKGVKGVMIGHLAILALSGNTTLPSSVSKQVVTELLQTKMGFHGLIVTDALNMNGITNQVASPALGAFLAGADVLLIPENLPKAISDIKSSYKNGTISSKRLATSVKKILTAKYELGLHLQHEVNLSKEVLTDTYFDSYLKQQIATESITLYHQSERFPILSETEIGFVSIGHQVDDSFLTALNGYAAVTRISVDGDLSTYKTLLIGVFEDTSTPWRKSSLHISDRAILQRLSLHPNAHVVFFTSPYTLLQFPDVSSFSSVLIAYEQNPYTTTAAAQLLFGQRSSKGILPVKLKD